MYSCVNAQRNWTKGKTGGRASSPIIVVRHGERAGQANRGNAEPDGCRKNSPKKCPRRETPDLYRCLIALGRRLRTADPVNRRGVPRVSGAAKPLSIVAPPPITRTS